MALLLPVTAALISLLILPGWSFWFDVTPKLVVALAGAAIALALPLHAPATLSRRLKWFGILALLQGVVILLATLFSTHPRLSWLGSTWRRSGVIAEWAVLIVAVLGAWRLASDASRMRIVLRITVLASVPVAAYGVLQYFGIDPWMPAAGYHFGEGQFAIVRPPSTLGHAAYFATYLLYAVFAGVALVSLETGRAWKLAAAAASSLAGFSIVLSGTRAALVGLLAGAVFLVARERWNWRWLGAGMAILVLLAGFYISPAGERLRARVHWSTEDPLGGARLWLWRDTLRMSRDRWLTGYGPETFAVEFPRYQSLELARAYPDFYHESPHNIFLDALISSGILGMLPLLALAVLGLALARGPIGAAFVATLVSNQFIAFTLPTELYFFLCLALLAGNTAPQPTIMITARPWRWALAAPLACFAVYVATGDALLAAARRAMDHGAMDRAARDLGRARRWNANADVYFSQRFLTQTPRDPIMRLRARLYAVGTAELAPLTADDRQNAFVNLAAVYATTEDARDVERNLRQAIAASPNWFKPHWLLAQLLTREGRIQEARAEAQAACDRDGWKDQDVVKTFDRLRAR